MDLRDDRRVLIVGWDGASLRIIQSLLREGKLPTIAGLLREGTLARMTSSVPTHSPPAWCTLLTGQNPGEHGVYDFLYREGQGYNTRPHLSKAIAGKAFWDVLTKEGAHVVLVNVPFTYPAYPIDGVMVAGFPCPTNSLIAYPPELEASLKQRHPDYRIDVTAVAPNYAGMDENEFQQEIYSIANSQLALTKDLLATTQWNLFMVVFTCLDRLQHVFWRHYDRTHPLHDPEKEGLFGETIPKFYCWLDDALKEMIGCLAESDIVIVCADHGFEPTRKYVGLNNFLEKKQLVKRYRGTKVGWSKEKVEAAMFQIGIGRLKKRLPHFMKDLVPHDVDYTKTKAYASAHGQIFLNVRGRDASGIVEPSSEYDTLRGNIAKYLSALEDPENHEAVVQQVFLREELYAGEKFEKAPDIVVVLREGYKPITWTSSGAIVESVGNRESKGSIESGGHHSFVSRETFMIASGDGVRKGGELTRMTLEDFAPSVLAVLWRSTAGADERQSPRRTTCGLELSLRPRCS